MELKTKRLILRAQIASDFPIVSRSMDMMLPKKSKWDVFNQEWAKRNNNKKAFNSRLNYLRKKAQNDEIFCLEIFLKKGNLWIGTIDAFEIKRGIWQSANLDYALHNAFWNKGYAKEALTKFLRYSFYKLNLHRLEVLIDPKNTASIALCKNIGMRCEGTRKSAVYNPGEKKRVDLKVYALTKEELKKA